MNTKRRLFVPTILLLLLTLAALVGAQDKQELLIDSSRNAVFKVTTDANADDVTGTANLQADFTKGLGALKGDLKFGPETQKDIKDGQGALYVNAATALLELVGDIDLALQPAPDMPKKLSGNLEAVFTEKKAEASGKLDVDAPATGGEVPKMNFDGTMEASAQNFTGKTDFSVDLKEAASQVPFKSFSINITEKDTASNISIAVTVDPKHPAAAQLRQLGKNPDMIKGGITAQLTQMKIQVEKVEMAPFEDKPEGVSAGLSILIKDWRGTVKQQLDAATASAGKDPESDAKKMADAATKLIETKIDNFDVKLNVDGAALKGNVGWNFSNAQSFLMGYSELALLIINQAQKEAGSDAPDKAKQFAMAMNQVQAEELQKAVKAMVESGAKLTAKGNLTVEGAPAAGTTPDADKQKGAEALPSVKVTGQFTANVENYNSYVEKAIAAGLPVGKNQVVILDVSIDENQHLKGHTYMYTDGKIAEYYKAMLMNVFAKMKGMEKVAELFKTVEFKSATAAFNVNKDGLTLNGYGEASDLGPVAKAALEQSGAPITGNPLGAAMDFKGTDKDSTVDINIYFSDFMKGKSDAEVKKVVGGDVTLNAKAKTEEVQLVAVTKPEVAVPAALVAYQKEGQAKMAAPASVIAGGGSGGGGGSLPIIGGVAVLTLLGVGVLAGRGKK